MGSSDSRAWQAVAATLYPVLRWAESSDAAEGKPVSGGALVTRPALPYLRQSIAFDNPRGRHWVTRGDMRSWGVRVDRLFDVAHDNARRMAAAGFDERASASVEYPQLRGDHSVMFGHDCVTSLPMVDGWLGGLRSVSGGCPIVFLPARDHLVIALGPDPRVLGTVVDLMGLAYDYAEHPLSPVPYALDRRGVLAPYTVSLDHPAYPGIRHARSRLAESVYARQTQLIQSRHREYLAPLIRRHSPGRPDYTLTTWIDGIATLLPRAEVIDFVDRRSTVCLRVGWSDVMAHVVLTPAGGFDPPRFPVRSHPSAEVMARLRLCAIVSGDVE